MTTTGLPSAMCLRHRRLQNSQICSQHSQTQASPPPWKKKECKSFPSLRILPITSALGQLGKNRLNIDDTISICDYIDRVLFLLLKFYTVLLYPLQSLLDQLLSFLNLQFCVWRRLEGIVNVVDQLWPFEQVLKSLGSHQLGRVDWLRWQDIAEGGRLQWRREDPANGNLWMTMEPWGDKCVTKKVTQYL